MSRMDPSRFADQSVDIASSDDPAEVSLDDAKRSAMVGQTIKAKIIQVRGLSTPTCMYAGHPPEGCHLTPMVANPKQQRQGLNACPWAQSLHADSGEGFR